MAQHGTNTRYHQKCRCVDCKAAHAKANNVWLKANPKPPKPKPPLKDYRKNCELCGAEFKVRTKGGMDRYRFCSTECGYKGRVCKATFAVGHPDLVPPESRGHSSETRRKISEGQRRNPRRKDFANRTERKIAMGRWEYREWRKAVFVRDDYVCQLCDKRGGYVHADHIVGWADDEGLRYEVSNGRTLCYRCHYKVTFGRDDPEKALLWGVPAKYRGGDPNF